MSYYVDQNGNAKKVLSVVLVEEVEVDYYVGCATLETSKQDSFVIPQSIQVGANYFPILDGTKTSLVELGGNSIAFNQLLDGTSLSNFTIENLTSSFNDNVLSVSVSNTSVISRISLSATIIQGHKYLLKETIKTGSIKPCDRINTTAQHDVWSSQDLIANVEPNTTYNIGTFLTAVSSYENELLRVVYLQGTKYEGGSMDISNIQLFDLTLMFGSGNEPTTIEQFNALFSSDYYVRQESNIKSTILSSVKAYSPQNALLGTINLPNAPITLNGVNNIHDTLTFEEQQDGTYNAILTRNIGIVDLGSISWSYQSENGRFVSTGINTLIKKVETTIKPNILCSKYQSVKYDSQAELTCFEYRNGAIYVRDSSFTDASIFRGAMSGVMLYYELATPTTETIATGLTFDEVSTLFEKGGTIVVENSNTDYIKSNITMAFAVRRFRTTEE